MAVSVIDKAPGGTWRTAGSSAPGRAARTSGTCRGKREPGESDVETLVREIAEELTVTIDPATARYVGRRTLGTFEAQADGHAPGVVVHMTCYAAEYAGTLTASSEIADLAWLTYADRPRVAAVDKLTFDHLHKQAQLH